MLQRCSGCGLVVRPDLIDRGAKDATIVCVPFGDDHLLVILAPAHASVAAGGYDISSGRLVASVAAVIGLISVVIGGELILSRFHLTSRPVHLGHVGPVQLDVVGTEPSQTAFDRTLDHPGREALGRLRPPPDLGRLDTHLGADPDAVPDARAVCQSAPEHRLALPAEAGRVQPERVAVGGVDPDADVHEPVQDLERSALVHQRAEERGAKSQVVNPCQSRRRIRIGDTAGRRPRIRGAP